MSGATVPTPYDRGLCNRREHFVPRDIERTMVATIAENDKRRHACDCGLVLIGNGHVEIRFGLLDYRFPPAGLPTSPTQSGDAPRGGTAGGGVTEA